MTLKRAILDDRLLRGLWLLAEDAVLRMEARAIMDEILKR